MRRLLNILIWGRCAYLCPLICKYKRHSPHLAIPDLCEWQLRSVVIGRLSECHFHLSQAALFKLKPRVTPPPTPPTPHTQTQASKATSIGLIHRLRPASYEIFLFYLLQLIVREGVNSPVSHWDTEPFSVHDWWNNCWACWYALLIGNWKVCSEKSVSKYLEKNQMDKLCGGITSWYPPEIS